jgi:hypothetical protein
MRLIAPLILAMLAVAAPARAAWNEYVYPKLGVAKDFPAPPQMEKGTYRAPLAKEVPDIVLSAVQGGITYRMTVVDFSSRAGEGANLLGEAESRQAGGADKTVTLMDFPLYDKGANSVYGTMLNVDKKDGEHAMSVLFFNKGRLYIVEAIVPAGNPNRLSPDLARFMPSIRFHLEGYGFDVATGHDYPLGDDAPEDRDTRPIKGYKPPAGFAPALDQPLANLPAK